ncbi:uncharacterized protein LOC110098947 [Dendrobium catenatum]|uniref:Uncharacterized protein n=1 Tax=Dendrobium catenatum TaxID=906689 RepID=A0A2I0XAD6_9ASPA|nr:uncharacterized protein LOC110098947 [Dendrobium catenatum]PKU84888.1 hypothetical protein MA16_Dca023391 [Dendrobium catenatum]
MAISAEKVPPSPREPLAPPVSPEPRLRRRVSFRSNLHDFDSPFLTTWGKQRVLRCLNVNRKGEIIAGHRQSDLIGPSANLRQDDNHVTIKNDDGSEGGKANLLPRLREAAAPNCRIYEPEPDHQPEVPRAPFSCAPAAPMPVQTPSSNSPSDVNQTYNMRSRRVPIRKKRCSSPSPPPPVVEKSVQRRSVRLRAEKPEKRDSWPKFSISLSRKEIEEDFIAITGSRPSRRPTKRPKHIQRQLDQLFPGLLLPSISPADYHVPD